MKERKKDNKRKKGKRWVEKIGNSGRRMEGRKEGEIFKK